MNERQKQAHMKVAHIYAELSYCERQKVGCVVISPSGDRVISIGYNGTPPGWDNVCECDGKTKPEVIHAEANALDKLYTSTDSAAGGFMFCTHNPCVPCAERIGNAQISTFYYTKDYKNSDGLDYLKKRNVCVEQLK